MTREFEDYENEIEDLHNRLDIAEYDKERLREEVTNLEAKIKALSQEPITRDVVGYEGLYTVDIFGNVFNADGKLMKQRTNEWGYFDIGLSKNNKQSRYKVHRLVAQAFIPNPQNKEQVNHIDGNKKNNAVWNLEWSTPQENTQHSIVTELRKTKTKDLTGERFGNLVVKSYLGDIRKAGALRHLWECQCDCGKVVTVIDNNLITGHAQSCGCQKGARKWRNPLSVMMR